jgi:hypothetical protein
MQVAAQPEVVPVDHVLDRDANEAAPQRRLKWELEAQVLRGFLVCARRVCHAVKRQRGGPQFGMQGGIGKRVAACAMLNSGARECGPQALGCARRQRRARAKRRCTVGGPSRPSEGTARQPHLRSKSILGPRRAWLSETLDGSRQMRSCLGSELACCVVCTRAFPTITTRLKAGCYRILPGSGLAGDRTAGGLTAHLRCGDVAAAAGQPSTPDTARHACTSPIFRTDPSSQGLSPSLNWPAPGPACTSLPATSAHSHRDQSRALSSLQMAIRAWDSPGLQGLIHSPRTSAQQACVSAQPSAPKRYARPRARPFALPTCVPRLVTPVICIQSVMVFHRGAEQVSQWQDCSQGAPLTGAQARAG